MNKDVKALNELEEHLRFRKGEEEKVYKSTDTRVVKEQAFYGGLICDTLLKYTDFLKIKYNNEDGYTMTLKDLISIIDGDTPLAIQESFSDVFEGYPRDAETEVHENVLNKRVKALYYSKLRSLIVIEV